MPINGRKYDWESVEIMAPNGLMIGVTEISYNDERGIEPRYGKGAVPRGYGRKNYKASGSMSLDKDEAQKLRLALGGTVFGDTPFPIVVKYGGGSGLSTTVDILPDCLITKQDTSAKQDDDNAGAIKYDFVILSPIKWDGMEAYE
jgi:hypothetical protein